MKKRKDGRYSTTLTVVEKGVKKRKYFYGKSSRELKKNIFEYREKQEKGKWFCEVAKEWEREHFPELAHTTLSCYEAPLKRAILFFENRYINDIEYADVQCFINYIVSKNFSAKTVNHHRIVLNLVFKYSIVHYGTTKNPVQYVSIPKNLPKTTRLPPSNNEIERIKNGINEPFGLFYYFLLYTGLRRGEALALEYEDIDFENNLIYVNKSIYYISNTPFKKLPKTEKGIRTVVLLNPLKQVLDSRKSGVVFSNEKGSYLTDSQLRKKMKIYKEKLHLTATPHQLRHAYATILFEAGISDKDAQDLLGHADISTTKNIYTHISEKRKQETTKQLNEFLLKR